MFCLLFSFSEWYTWVYHGIPHFQTRAFVSSLTTSCLIRVFFAWAESEKLAADVIFIIQVGNIQMEIESLALCQVVRKESRISCYNSDIRNKQPIHIRIHSYSPHAYSPWWSKHLYPLVNVYIAMERSTMLLMGKSTISMAIFNCYVSSPEGKCDPTISNPDSSNFGLSSPHNSRDPDEPKKGWTWAVDTLTWAKHGATRLKPRNQRQQKHSGIIVG